MFLDARYKFGGYAILIALPALILAGLGGLSLRDDSITASLEVKERGGLIIAELDALRGTVQPKAMEDLTDSWEVTLNDHFQLIEPPVVHNANDSNLYSGEIPSAEIQVLFDGIEKIDSESALEAFFLKIEATDLSIGLRAMFLFRLADVQAKYSKAKSGMIHKRLIDDFFFERSATGIPFGVLCVLELSKGPEFGKNGATLLEGIGQRLLMHPEPFTATCIEAISDVVKRHLELAEEDKGVSDQSSRLIGPSRAKAMKENWSTVESEWREGQTRREFYQMAKIELHLGEAKPRSAARLRFRNQDLIVWIQEGERRMIGRPYLRFLQELDQALDIVGVNPFFQTRILIGDGSTVGFSGGQEVARGQIAPNLMWPGLTAVVSLSEPARYFASVKQRRWRFGILIGLALLSVGLGLIAINRTFKRQQRVNEQRSNFVASVSHELRTPTASISLLSEELLSGNGNLERYHRLIHSESQRLSALVENVLDVSRIDRGSKEYDFEVCDLVALIESTVESFRPAADRLGISIDVEKETQELDGVVDPIAIQRALSNLLDNAVKFSSKGSRVLVSIERKENENLISVADEGKGIDADALGVIFEPFQRLGSEMRRESKGIGLGLALVKHIVEGHHGQIDVESEEGRGAVFRIRLPRGLQDE